MDKIYLKVEDLLVSRRGFSISNVSFDLKSGNILGLVGRSGSGKSTLIKAMVGLIRPKMGTITSYYNDMPAPLSYMIGYSPQENALYPYLTLEENLFLFGELYKIEGSVITQRMDFLLKRLNLQDSKNKRITELSGGMKKRADLAVTLIHSPNIIILDEPFNGLDVSLQKFIWTLLRELAKEGKIIIVSSHMLNDIQRNCNQFGLVENGQFYNNHRIVHELTVNKQNLEPFLENMFGKNMATVK